LIALGLVVDRARIIECLKIEETVDYLPLGCLVLDIPGMNKPYAQQPKRISMMKHGIPRTLRILQVGESRTDSMDNGAKKMGQK
jgi:hypothetical protein